MPDPLEYDARNWYWRVNGGSDRYSSRRGIYVDTSDTEYTDWLASGGHVTNIDDEVLLNDVLLRAASPQTLSRTFTPAEVIASMDALDHGVTSGYFTANEISGIDPVEAGDVRLSQAAADLQMRIGTIA